ncbi:MAG TPA: ArsB/NhaD family transporter [Anaerolineales bacterium]|nr:ArsB/NhaD family transporter [Anaerolineales bacterium]
MNMQVLAVILFLITYAIIVSERVHRTPAALLGGMLMILLGVLSQETAFKALDLNVIFLLTGMMMIAYLLGETGVFQWMAVNAAKMGKGDPMRIMVILCVITAFSSALLDNVTVVVLMAPVTLFVATDLGLSPIPFLITQVIASNIGGAATLIGDPPNIMIASHAGIDFTQFVVNMAPPSLLILLVFLAACTIFFRKRLVVQTERRQAVLRIQTKGLIRDPVLLAQSLIILGFVLIGFISAHFFGLEPATIALLGATILLIWTRRSPVEILEHVEWATLMFFVGLFVTVEGLVQTGVIDRVADQLINVTHGNLPVTTLGTLWFSAFASGIIDNIPYTATMIPLVENLGESMDIKPLWWALALGADLGGNLTLVGASANLIVASIAERSGFRISFWEFFRYGLPTVLVSLLISTLWLWLVYL